MIYSFENRPESIATSHPQLRDMEYPTLIHKQIEIIYMLGGKAVCNIDGIESSLSTGDLAVVFPYVAHSYSFTGAEYVMLFFQPDVCPDYELLIKKQKPIDPIIKDGRDGRFGELIRKARAAHVTQSDLGIKLTKSYINVIMGELLGAVELTEHSASDHSSLNALLSYCSENYVDPAISINSLSKAIGISPKHCSHIISTLMNTNFRQYINSLRVFEAARLLANTELAITRIALDVGYENQSTFNRVFLNQYGMTPKEYRLSKQIKK